MTGNLPVLLNEIYLQSWKVANFGVYFKQERVFNWKIGKKLRTQNFEISALEAYLTARGKEIQLLIEEMCH